MNKPNANVSLQVLPTVPDAELFRVVDAVIDYIAASGVKHVVGPLDTTMEGDLDDLMPIVTEAQKICIREGAGSVMSIVKISYNPEGTHTISEKTDKYNK